MQGYDLDALEPINVLADTSPGFVWRLQDESGDATSIQGFDDPSLLVNLSVWETVRCIERLRLPIGAPGFPAGKKAVVQAAVYAPYGIVVGAVIGKGKSHRSARPDPGWTR